MYKHLTTSILLIFFLLSFGQTSAQVDDNIMWASVVISKNFSSKTSAAFAPILRLEDDISQYQNSSIDLSVKHKFANNCYGQVLSRVWFLPDNVYRKFFFFDVGYSRKVSPLKVSSYLRAHYALTIKDRKDPDFLRWGTTLSLTTFKKVQPFLFVEPFLRLNKQNELKQLRYALGVKLNLAKQLNLTLALRPQTTLNKDKEIKVNHVIVTLAYAVDK